MELKYQLMIAIVVIASVFIVLVIKDNKKLKQSKIRRPYEERDIKVKKLAELPVNETIIVVGFDDKERPMAQFVHDFQEEMREREGECFMLSDGKQLVLLEGKTYEIGRADFEGTVFLRQVALFITADYVVG